MTLIVFFFSEHILVRTSLRNRCLSSATLLAAAIVTNVSVMSFPHHCLGFHRLLSPATITCIIVFSKPLLRIGPNVAKVFQLFTSYKLIQPVRWCDELSRVYGIFCGSISSEKHLFFCYLICAVPMFHTHVRRTFSFNSILALFHRYCMLFSDCTVIANRCFMFEVPSPFVENIAPRY